jgi:hypothetical protein
VDIQLKPFFMQLFDNPLRALHPCFTVMIE